MKNPLIKDQKYTWSYLREACEGVSNELGIIPNLTISEDILNSLSDFSNLEINSGSISISNYTISAEQFADKISWTTWSKSKTNKYYKRQDFTSLYQAILSLPVVDVARLLWKELADVPLNQFEEIDAKFIVSNVLTFEKGTDINDIWSWFEETYNISIAEDLICLK